MTKSPHQLSWSRSELRMANWTHGAFLSLAALSFGLAFVNGIGLPPLFWSSALSTALMALAAVMVHKKPALKVDAASVYLGKLLFFPWHYQRRPRSQLKWLERKVVDGQIVRYVAHTHEGDELLLPTAPRIEHVDDVAALDTFMQQHFADLLTAPKATA